MQTNEALWARVKARQQDVRIEIGRDADGKALNRLHRRRFLLSGLLVCGCCGGSYRSPASIGTAAPT